VQTLFFDLGDTLMHIHPSVPTLYLEACMDLGMQVELGDVEDALHAGEELYREAARNGRPFEASLSEARLFWLEYNQRILAALGVVADQPSLARTLSERFWAPASWRVFPEVHEVLDTLRGAGVRLAVVSNFTDALVTVCRTHELDDYFDCLVASVTVGSQKPDTYIFREALRRTGADPATTVHVGDNYVADVLGARAVGIDGVLIDRSRFGVVGMFDFTLRGGGGGTQSVRLDCPVIGDLRELLSLVA